MYEGEFVGEYYRANGLWKIDYIYTVDEFGNDAYIYNSQKYDNDDEEIQYDFSVLDFTLSGTRNDFEAPQIIIDTLEISNKEVLLGETVTFSVNVMDDSEISSVRLYLHHPERWETYDIALDFNEITGKFEGNLKLHVLRLVRFALIRILSQVYLLL